jgi:hypothetical protein
MEKQMTDEIFTEEIFEKMQRRVYWAVISCMIGICLAAFGLNAIVMFFTILVIGYFNPDDRIKGVVN